MLTVVVDPLKELRTFFNLVYLNAILSDFCFGLLINPYRAWGNKMKADGVNFKKLYPYSKTLAQLCHTLYIAGQLVSLFSLTVMSAHLVRHVYKDKTAGKVHYPSIALVSVLMWALATGLASVYFVYGFQAVEMPVTGVTAFGSLVAIIANYIILYKPAKKRLTQVHAHTSAVQMGHNSSAQHEKNHSMVPVESITPKENGDERTDKDEVGHSGVSKVDHTPANQLSSEEPNHQRFRNVKALLFYYVILFGFSGSSWVIGYASVYDKVLLSCAGGYFWQGWKLMFMVMHKAFNPFICMLFIKSLRQGCLQLLRLRNFRRVAPNA